MEGPSGIEADDCVPVTLFEVQDHCNWRISSTSGLTSWGVCVQSLAPVGIGMLLFTEACNLLAQAVSAQTFSNNLFS